MAIRIESSNGPSCSRVEIPRSASTVHSRPPPYCTHRVLEEPEAEARAEAADKKATDLKGSDDRISYKEAIGTTTSPEVKLVDD